MKRFILTSLSFLLVNIALLQAQSQVTYTYTGGVQSYTVPTNVSIVSLTVAGAQGGNGGYGAVYIQTMAVTAGQVLNIYVGGAGTQGSGAAGGYNGGGQAGSAYGNEGSGGGASDIRVSPYGLADRIIVAGGGGGVGGYYGGSGGAGGLSGSAGYAGQGGAGGGGTSSAGGSGGVGNGCGTGGNGSLGSGGAGGACSFGGGGGGGGYYGGGGGGADNNSCCADGGGGGGGSSYCSTSGGICSTGGWSGAGRVIIKPLNGITIFQTSPVICNGQLTGALSATVNGGTAPYTYIWSTGATTSTIGGLAAGTYTCRALSASAVSYSETFTIVQPPIFVGYLYNQYNLTCNGGNDGYLSVSIGGGVYPYTYTWSPSGGNYYVASALTAGQYTCSIGDGNGCIATVTANLIQPAAPSIIAGASSSAVCAGGSVTLIGGGASNYTWTNGVTDGVPFAPATSTNYIVTGFDYNGCPGYAQVSVMVNPNPTVSASPATSVCSGISTTLSATGAVTYAWNTGTPSASTVVTPTLSTFYTVAGTNSLGCTSTSTVSVYVYTLPTLGTLLTSTAVCAGSFITAIALGANTFTWSGNIINGVPFQPTISKVYTVSGTDLNGCVNSTTSSVVVNPLPLLTIGGSTGMCQGYTEVLTASGAATYTWSTNAITPSISVSPQSSSVYFLTGKSVSGCINSISFSLMVSPAPTVVASTSSTLVCDGSIVTLVASGATSYTWEPVQSNSSSVAVTPSSATTYTLIGDANGCANSTTFALSVIPVPTLVLNGPGTICALMSATLSASGASSYTWSNGNTTQSVVVSAPSTSVFIVTGTGSNGCNKTDSITLTIKPLPAVAIIPDNSIICQGISALLTATGAASYSWNTLDTNAALVVSPSVTTSYTVMGIGSNGCSNSASFILTISGCDKIPELTKEESPLTIYPNPTTGSFSISSKMDLKLKLINSAGQLIKTFTLTENSSQKVEAKELSNGIYFIVGEGQGKIIHQKIIITN